VPRSPCATLPTKVAYWRAPYEIVAEGRPTGIVELPVKWIRDDAVYFMNRQGAQRPYTPPGDVLDIFIREFEGARAENGLFW